MFGQKLAKFIVIVFYLRKLYDDNILEFLPEEKRMDIFLGFKKCFTCLFVQKLECNIYDRLFLE